MLTIEAIRCAYERACLKLDRFGALDTGIKIAMCDDLDCDPWQLDSILSLMSAEDIYEKLMS